MLEKVKAGPGLNLYQTFFTELLHNPVMIPFS